jgi:hypothetical protein
MAFFSPFRHYAYSLRRGKRNNSKVIARLASLKKGRSDYSHQMVYQVLSNKTDASRGHVAQPTSEANAARQSRILNPQQ